MYVFGKINVKPNIPKRIEKISDLAFNLWWSWNSYALRIFELIDIDLWKCSKYNPVKFLNEVSQDKLNSAIKNEEFLNYFDEVIQKFEAYLNSKDTHFSKNYKDYKNKSIAYFSMEFGLDEIIPIYSGGLGILAGDHIKSASDLGIPLTGIGLFYSEGFFVQHIDNIGDQIEYNPSVRTSELPLIPVLNNDGSHLIICVNLNDVSIYAKVHQVNVGRNKLYLLDSNVPENNNDIANLTNRLYGGDQETRILQEILLGIGGISLLNKLDINANVFHMNEGHSAFLTLELIRQEIEKNNIDFNIAKDIVMSKTAFTIHTPVPAGIDTFPISLVEKYFDGLWDKFKISKNEFLHLGTFPNKPEQFNMAVLAMKTSGKRNGVSKLHGHVTQDMFSKLWDNISIDEVPITYVTNGVHTCTWLSPLIKDLFNKYLPPFWQDNIQDISIWNNINNIPNKELWDAHVKQKVKLINTINNILNKQNKENGTVSQNCNLSPDILTIGFARRFATYKRANLIFKDIERILKIINNPDMPVQIIFAGKAHPADKPGQDIIKEIIDLSNSIGFKGKIYFIENYNMALSRYLISGTDIWLNNPRRPMEASGTSGQKAGLNGNINFSILDGWWCEGYNTKNGFKIGDETEYPSYELQDISDSNDIYSVLENEIIPLFYNREHGVPNNWIELMKESIKTVSPNYSSSRMILDYLNKIYLHLINKQTDDLYSKVDNVIKFGEYKNNLKNNWNTISILWDDAEEEINTISQKQITLKCSVISKNIDVSGIDIQVYFGKIDGHAHIIEPQIKSMEQIIIEESNTNESKFKVVFHIENGGEYAYTFRVVPKNDMIISDNDLNLVKWFEKG